MVTILLEQIIELLKGFIESFKDHAAEVAEKLGLISEDTSDINDNTDIIVSLDSAIKDNTDILVANTGAIKNSSQATSTNTAAIASDTTVIRNNINTISVNSGKTAAFSEDTATNTLNILDKVTTIASDTTQIRSDNQVLISNTNDLETYLKLTGKGIIKESYSDGTIVSFDTDLKNILNSYEFIIPPSTNGFTNIEITICGINLLDEEEYEHKSATMAGYPEDGGVYNSKMARYRRIPSNDGLTVKYKNTDPNSADKYYLAFSRIVDGTVESTNGWFSVTNTETIYHVDPLPNSYIRMYLYCPQMDLEYPFMNEIIITKGNSEEYEYIPFKGKHFYIDLGETLTQGGSYNVKTGVLTRSDKTTKQLTALDIPTLLGDNNIFNSVASFNDVSYNETIYNYIEREV